MDEKEKSAMDFTRKFVEVQSRLRAPKGQYNSFGKYKYRSAEDILNAVKPLLHEYGLLLTMSDSVRAVGNRFYVEATATITDGEGHSASATALAREDDTKKGMDGSQITGTASSYARKYALNGLFCIDDTKDADAMDNRAATPENRNELQSAIAEAAAAKSRDELGKVWNAHKDLQKAPEFVQAVTEKGQEYKKA